MCVTAFSSVDEQYCKLRLHSVPLQLPKTRRVVHTKSSMQAAVVGRGAVTRPDTDHDLYCTNCGQRLNYSTTDKLTGLLDRWGWDSRAEEAIAKAGNRASTLLLVDLDSFKSINDLHGHLAGDAVLQAAASVLKDALRTTDVAGRYGGHGGDEFLVLLPARDRQLGELIARRIRARIRRAIIPVLSAHGEPIVLSGLAASIGVAISDPTTARTLTLLELIRQADAALLSAKNGGGDQIVVAGGGVARLTSC